MTHRTDNSLAPAEIARQSQQMRLVLLCSNVDDEGRAVQPGDITDSLCAGRLCFIRQLSQEEFEERAAEYPHWIQHAASVGGIPWEVSYD